MLKLSHVETSPEGEARILDLLFQHADDKGMPFKPETWLIEAHEDETFLGGLCARAGSDFVFVQYLAVSPEARGRGLGSKLLQDVEKRAKDAGKLGVYLDTFAFQAPDFYKAEGYIEFGRLKGAHYGQDRFYFVKTF